MSYFFLSDRTVLSITGDDAREFLQGLISNDIRKAAPGEAVFAALLSPQGKFLYDFFITQQDGVLLLDVHEATASDLKKRLSLYRLRSKVEIHDTAYSVAALWDATPDEQHNVRDKLVYADPRLPSLGQRVIATSIVAPSAPEEYMRHRLALGIPDGAYDLQFDRSLLLEYGYDELHGVDFDKGCYVGQEVTARSKHRASLRKFIHQVEASAPLPAPQTSVTYDGREVGVMASSLGTLGLAHLRVEDVVKANSAGAPLVAVGISLKAALPAWCATRFTAEEPIK